VTNVTNVLESPTLPVRLLARVLSTEGCSMFAKDHHISNRRVFHSSPLRALREQASTAVFVRHVRCSSVPRHLATRVVKVDSDRAAYGV
jgi:hypothetical protein